MNETLKPGPVASDETAESYNVYRMNKAAPHVMIVTHYTTHRTATAEYPYPVSWVDSRLMADFKTGTARFAHNLELDPKRDLAYRPNSVAGQFITHMKPTAIPDQQRLATYMSAVSKRPYFVEQDKPRTVATAPIIRIQGSPDTP